MKRSLFAIVVIAAFSISAHAKPFPYSGGSGTVDDPYKIANASDLLELSAAFTSDYDKYFVLTADIDLGSSGTFTTAIIAPDTNNSDLDYTGFAFKGVFDGNNHTISNLTINTAGAGNDYLGLFGYVSWAMIQNLRLENVSITGGNNSHYIGGLAGAGLNWTYNCSSTGEVTGGDNSTYIGGLIGKETREMRNCKSTVTVIGGHNSQYVGGLIGDSGYIISNCYTTGNVRGGNYSSRLGGLAGAANKIINCHSTGSVNGGNYSTDLGGLVGEIRNYIDFSYSTGTVTGGISSVSLGGLAGFINEGAIGNCYSTGNVSAASGSQRIGGLAGYNYTTLSRGGIFNSYSAGLVSGGVNSSDIGGLVGFDSEGMVAYCYFNINNGPDNGLGTPLTDEQMMQQASFTGFDFAGEKKDGTFDIWAMAEIAEGIYYPALSWVQVAKCSVIDGKKDNSDKIYISGQLDAGTIYDFDGGRIIEITIKSKYMNRYCEPNFPINNKTFKNGRYSYTGIDNGVKKSFKYDAKTRKFTFSASDVNLMGLSCPIMMHIHIGNYFGTDVVDETIVNAKMPAPISLMMGVNNTLRVDKIQIKQNFRKPNSDQLIVKGGFAVADTSVNMVDSDLNIILNGDPFMIPQGKLKPSRYNDRFSCSKVELGDGRIAYIDFNFKRCTFSATIKNADIPELTGPVELGVMFGDFDESVLADLL
jgi:hypothetical protein